MGWCVYFHRTWVPGYNSEYLDPNLAYSFQQKLQLAKKVVLWAFVMMLMICVIVLLIKLYSVSLPGDCGPGNVSMIQSTQLSQPTAESHFQTLQLKNLTEEMDKDLNGVTSSLANENTIGDSDTEEQHRSTENTEIPKVNDHTFVLNETSTKDYQIQTPKPETPKLEETTLVYLITEETTNTEADTEKTTAFTDLLNEKISSSESSESLVKRNITTREDSSTQRFHAGDPCGPTDFRCNSTQKCIPVEQKCDGRFDCAEIYPSTTEGKSKPNFDRSDEIGCDCGPESFVCEKNTTIPTECIHRHLVCDSQRIQDCSNGKDEAVCVAASESLTKVSVVDKRQKEIKGYVLVRVRGSWHPYCAKVWSTEMGRQICKYLKYRKLVQLHTIGLLDLNRRIGVKLTGRGRPSEEIEGTEKSTLWLLNGNEDYMAVTGGPIEDVVTEATGEEDHDCTVAHIFCSN